ncbi:MAG: FAD-binding oxidoreductase, partial [Maioricimonas sp. JB049]
MDELQQRISEDLAGMFRGGLEFDVVTRSMFAADASLYEIRPLGVAFPRDREDVAVLARYTSENDIPLIPRGAGTGLAGGAVGSGLVVDFSRHMTGIEEIGPDFVRVQTGVVLNVLNRALRESGRYFPPDPSNAAVTTIGGMLAVDAAGSHASRVGSTRDHVKSIEVVLADGTVIETGVETPRPPPPPVEESLFPSLEDLSGVRRAVDGETRRHQITQRLRSLLRENEELIRTWQRPLIRNCSGYHLRNVLVDETLHLPRLLVGSEGTLALFTAATLHTSPLPAHRGVV